MDAADTDNEDVDDPITLIGCEQNPFRCYVSKEKASYKQDDRKASEKQVLITINRHFNVAETTNMRCSSLKEEYKCYPLSIKLVDYKKYPWYYKLDLKVNALKENMEINKNQEESEPNSSDSDVDDIICLNPICVKHKVMHNQNATHIPKCNKSAKEDCLLNEKKISKLSNVRPDGSCISNEYRGTIDCLRINFKKNTGLIGMRVRRRISTDKVTQTGDNEYQIQTNSIHSGDFIKSPVKGVISTKPVYTKNILDRNELSQLNLKENILINKETPLSQDNSPSNSKLEMNSSPILQLNAGNNKVKKYPIKLTSNVSRNDNKEKVFLSGRLLIKKDGKYFNDSKLSEIGTSIGEINKSPILTIHSYKKLSSTQESRTKSPIFLCKNNTKTKMSNILPRRKISSGSQDAISDEKNNFYGLKKNVSLEDDRVLEKKQKQSCFFMKDRKKNNRQASGKLNNIVENLHKRKLEQKVDSISSEIINSKEKDQIIKNGSKNNYEINKVKKNTSSCRTNHKENNTTNSLSLNNLSHIKSYNLPVFSPQSQNFSPHKLSCNFNQLSRYDKASTPFYSERRHPKHFMPLSASGPMVRQQIPHKHIRIPPVSSVLLNYTKLKQTSPSANNPKLSILLDEKKKAETLTQLVTKPTTCYAKCKSRETVVVPKSDFISHKNVQRTEAIRNNEFLNQNNGRNISQNKVQMTEITRNNEFFNHNNGRKGYSPPILPIPTYHTTFEYLARFSSGELQKVAQNSHNFHNQMVLDSTPTSSKFCVDNNHSLWKDSFGKRKFDTTDMSLKKKISLTGYTTRLDELGHTRIDESLGNKPNKLQDPNIYPSLLSCLKNAHNCYVQSDNLGYDSDSTVRL